MDAQSPRIVIDPQGECDNGEVFTDGAQPPSRLRSRRGSFPWKLDGSGDDNGDDIAPGNAFAKLVRTVQFIKKWARRAEREPDSARDEFLDRFKMNGPNIDSAFARSFSEEEEEEVRKERHLWKLLKRKHLTLIWNPSGQWLYRLVVMFC